MSEVEDAVDLSLTKDKYTDAVWDFINGAIKTAAVNNFGKGKHEDDEKLSDLKQER